MVKAWKGYVVPAILLDVCTYVHMCACVRVSLSLIRKKTKTPEPLNLKKFTHAISKGTSAKVLSVTHVLLNKMN